MASNSLPQTGIVYPNDFSLGTLTLLTSVTTFDIKSIMVELSYNEDIFNNATSGYVMVIDSSGFIEKLNMNGNEFLRMTLGKTNAQTNVIDKLFRVFKVAKRTPENEGNTESYALYFCSEELLLSEQYKVSKSYKGKDIRSNVMDILTNYLNVPDEKMGVFESTYGVYDFIVPNIKPFDAINWLSTYARPNADNLGADMLLYEDKFGYNYRSLQTLFAQEVYNEYSFNPKNLSQNIQTLTQQIYNVLTYEILESYDTLGAINSGVYSNRLLSVDPLLRRTRTTDFNYASYSDNVEPLNEFPIINNIQNRFGDTLNDTPQAVYKLVFSNFNQSDSALVQANGGVTRDIYAETFIPYRTAQLPLLNYTRVKISVPGDPDLTVGRVITFNLLSKDPIKKDTDDFYSGNYLITAVRHMLTMHQYRTVLELAKESTVVEYSGVDNTSTIWQNTVKGITK
jgi:hypothetical protein